MGCIGSHVLDLAAQCNRHHSTQELGMGDPLIGKNWEMGVSETIKICCHLGSVKKKREFSVFKSAHEDSCVE